MKPFAADVRAEWFTGYPEANLETLLLNYEPGTEFRSDTAASKHHTGTNC